MTSMPFIESRHNVRVKSLKKLKEKRHRSLEGKYLVEGFRLLEEAFKARKNIEVLLYAEDKEDDFNRYIRPYLQEEEVLLTTMDVIRELSSTVHPQGIVGVISKSTEPMEKNLVEKPEGLFIYLDGLQDPGNLGTIIRSAHASGAKGILMGRNTVDPYGDKVVRSAMGSMFHVNIYENGEELLDRYLEAGFRLAVTSLLAERDIFHEDLTGNLIIAIGNEGNGITREIEEKAHLLLKIPMPGGAESLNAAVAASIVLFERVRQDSL